MIHILSKKNKKEWKNGLEGWKRMEIPACQPSDFPSVFIGLIMLTVLVSGCAKHRLETYQELRDTKIQRPAYYYTEVEKKVTNTEM